MLFEKERPTVLAELIDRDKEIAEIKRMIESDDGIPHLLFSGKAGTGKTTMANIIANELFQNKGTRKTNYYEFNASDSRGIEFVRKTLIEICKRRPFGGAKYKVILLDEADNITPDAQQCLRRVMEQYHKTTRFILTANYPFRIIAPLQSRVVHFQFEQIKLIEIAKYLKRVSNKYNLGYTDDKLKAFARMSNGDLRKALNNLDGNIETNTSEALDGLTLSKLSAMSIDDKITKFAFAVDPDAMFSKLWELVQKEKAWDKLYPLSDCNHKMNMSVHKNLFIATLLEKHF